jgi:GH15 family glucan-1,4-alpha-glucosidase
MGWLQGRFRYADRESGPLQIMYGIDGREDLSEEELPHLEGYVGSAPVRIGNGAATQLQLDISGELMDSVYLCNKFGLPIYYDGWLDLTRNLEWLIDHWDQPDEGIWEARGGRRNYTYSRLMSWVAIDRAIRVAQQRGLPGDITRWSDARDRHLQPDHGARLESGATGVRTALRQRRARRLATAHAPVQVHRAYRPAVALNARCHHCRTCL